eukprot:TRINITY_DN1610_c0_g1_i2.p2 TRINITY_DN1610_c0_g1~~TRINITY_DN1610_c0_g1_i2.p2  ORF type:complete len:108 (+),score=32.91 TRINITY_DN1610_c0_g1_i2:108-431(+)
MAGEAAPAADATPIATSAVLMAASRHITARCGGVNKAFLECKRRDENPEVCLKEGQDVTRCALSLLNELHAQCPKAMDDYCKCMNYYSSEFPFCRKQQATFEKACPI